MKILLLAIVLVAIVFVVVHYLAPYAPHPSSCASGSTYARKATGGGWIATDSTDPLGMCVPDLDISAGLNQ